MAALFPGANYDNRALERVHTVIDPLAGPTNMTRVYSVRVNTLPNTYHTIVGLMQPSYSGNLYTFTAILQPGGSPPQRFCISDGYDTADGAPTLTQWYRQAFRVETVGTDHVKTFWPDLIGSPATKVVQTLDESFFPAPLTTSHRLRFGDTPWSVDERLDGAIGEYKDFHIALSDADVEAEGDSIAPVTAAGIANLHTRYDFPNDANFLNDTSGNGLHLSQTTGNAIVYTAGMPGLDAGGGGGGGTLKAGAMNLLINGQRLYI